jgi:hypothetical protein
MVVERRQRSVKPGNCALANWLKKQGLTRPSDYDGVLISVYEDGQSYERKLAYDNALAKAHGDVVLRSTVKHVWTDAIDCAAVTYIA